MDAGAGLDGASRLWPRNARIAQTGVNYNLARLSARASRTSEWVWSAKMEWGGGGRVDDMGTFFFASAKRVFDSGENYFPIWGTCLGFEQLAVLAQEQNMLKRYKAVWVRVNTITTEIFDP